MDNAPQEPVERNNRLDHQEEEEDSKWDISLYFSNSKVILLDSIKEPNDISFETLERNHVLNSEILNQVVDIPFENSHELFVHDFLKEQFGRVLEELQLEQLCYGRYIAENFVGYNDLVDEYMENICSGNGGLYVCSKYQISHHNLFPVSSSFLIKHVEKSQSLDQLLDWLHRKSKFT